MFIQQDARQVNFKVFVASPADEGVQCLVALAKKVGTPMGDIAGAGGLTLPLAFNGLPGWKTEMHLYTVTHPSLVAVRILTLKQSDGVLFAVGQAAGFGGPLVAEVRSHLEEMGYNWEAFPRVALTPQETDAASLGGTLAVVGDPATGVGITGALRVLTTRFLADARQELARFG